MPVLHVFGETIEYDIVESTEATQPRIDVDIHGVTMILPAGAEIEPETLADENAQWVLEQWRQYRAHREQAPTREFTEGEIFPYLGDERSLAIEPTDAAEVTAAQFVLPEADVVDGNVQESLKDLYRRKARKHFQERIDDYAGRLNVDPGRLELRNQRTRWASCSPHRTLSFNWRLIMAPPEVVDYVVIHELAHLRERNHTKRFWRIIEEHDPEFERHVEWLKENGVRLIFTEEDL